MADNIVREMCRCVVCQAWWSTDGDMQKCPCGGDLAIVDMDAHMATLPKKPYDPSKDGKK